MANQRQRMVNTRFWDDNYTSNLDPIEKLMFLYFLTNTSTNISGVYEIPIKKIANETGIDKEMVIKQLDRFARDSKIFYIEGWIGIKNFIKHQSINPSVEAGIARCMKEVPIAMINRLSTDCEQPALLNLTKLNLTKPNLTETVKVIKKENFLKDSELKVLIDLFKEVNPSYLKFFSNTSQRKALDELAKAITLEKLTEILKALPSIVCEPFAPKITSPTDLQRDLGKLIIFVKQKKNLSTSNLQKIIL